MSTDFVCLGHIAGAHGVRGDVLIKSYTAVPGDIGSYGPLDDGTGRLLEIVSVRETTKGVVARLKGVVDRNAAEVLKGTRLHVARDVLPEPDDDEWYFSDLIGLEAWHRDGKLFGAVVGVQDFGAGDLLEIRPKDEDETVFIPFTRECVPEVLIDDGRIIVQPPDVFSEDDVPDD